MWVIPAFTSTCYELFKISEFTEDQNNISKMKNYYCQEI